MGARYYHMYNERCDDGKVYTRPEMGASYFHMGCCNTILHDPLSDLTLLWTWLSFLFLFFIFGPSCVQLIFFFFHLDIHVPRFFSIAMPLL
jgi:hypothetical protein